VTELAVPGLGPLAWIDVVLIAWLTGLSVAYVAYDAFNNQELTVIKCGWSDQAGQLLKKKHRLTATGH
jgi:hypothetical protein